MNGKRAKALNRIRSGIVRLEDVARLKRTELKPTTEPKSDPVRKKPVNGLTPLALAARKVGL